MKQNLIIITIFLIAALPECAWGQFSARAKIDLSNTSVKKEAAQVVSRPMFVEVADASCFDTLRTMGVTINSRFGNRATIIINPSQVADIVKVKGVKHIATPIQLSLTNDTARALGNVDPLHHGMDTGYAFTGRGVVVGVIDTGFDFNHVNFMDEKGRSRVKRVYMPYDSTGVSPVIDGDTLPGSHYDNPLQIALLTTDTPNASHGTHTAGTAAGGCRLNNYYGVAPDADLVLCGMPALYDSDIANCIKYICHYANEANKPVVISMSFSSQDGAHDGTSQLCQLFNEMSQPGRVFVISAGNSARERIYLKHDFNSVSTDTLRTYIDIHYTSSSYKGYVSGWSSNEKPHRVGITVIDKNTRKEIASTPMLELSDSVLTLAIDSIPELKPYLNGEILYASALEDNGRFHSIVEMDVVPTSTNYRIGLKFTSDDTGTFHAWSQGVIMINDANVPGYTAAVRDCCISDLATTNQVISVGAFSSRSTIPTADGGSVPVNRSQPYDIAYFSSYGPDANGISRPDVCAPGLSLVSSASRFVEDGRLNYAYIERAYDEEFPYVGMSGTSMSTPFVAGVIAQWMQHFPHLDATMVRDIISHTAIRDTYVSSGNTERWGYGKIDALGGLKYILQSHPLPIRGDMNDDGIVDVEDVNEIINLILGIQ